MFLGDGFDSFAILSIVHIVQIQPNLLCYLDGPCYGCHGCGYGIEAIVGSTALPAVSLLLELTGSCESGRGRGKQR